MRNAMILVGFFFLALVWGGCGSSSEGESATDSSSDTASDTAASAETLEEVAGDADASSVDSNGTIGSVHLITLGDSLTEGVGDSEWTDDGVPVGYPGRLTTLLADRGQLVELSNLGRSGWTSAEMVNGNEWEEDGASQLDLAIPLVQSAVTSGTTTVVCVWIGSNDLFGLYSWCHAPDNADCEAEDLTQFRGNIDKTLKDLTAAGATVQIALLDDQSLRPVMTDPKYADAFSEIGASDKALMSAQVVRYNEAIAELATKYGAETVDFYSTTLFQEDAMLAEDGNHPNGSGYDTIAAIWNAAIDL